MALKNNKTTSSINFKSDIQRNGDKKGEVVRLRLFPDELRNRRQWLCWGQEGNDKMPISPISGKSKDWNNPENWGTYREAKQYMRRNGLKGIGFVLSRDDPFMVIDLDNARNPKTGKLKDWAQHLVDHFASFTEISMSGKGLHIFLKVDQPPGKSIQTFQAANDAKGKIEVFYAQKFIANTGECLDPAKPIKRVDLSTALSQIKSQTKEGFTPLEDDGKILKGSRNTTLFNLARMRINRGWPEGRIKRNIRKHNRVKCLPPLKSDEVDQILKNALKYKDKDVELFDHIQDCVLSLSEYLQQDFKKPKAFLKPWLREGSLAEIHASRGIGKSWLALIIALSLTRRDYANIEIGKWQVKHTAGVLLVDGEMSDFEIQQRIKMLSGLLGPEQEGAPLRLFTSSILHRRRGVSINIVESGWRKAISMFLSRNPEIKVLILDNLASLAPGVDENVKRDWDNINQWLLSLRHQGIAVIFVHHEGKSGQQRGTSGREDNLDVVIKLSPIDGRHGAFRIEFRKGRYLEPKDYKSFILSLEEAPEGGLTWRDEEVGRGNQERDKQILALRVWHNWPRKKIAEQFGLTDTRVSQIFTKAENAGFVTGKRKNIKLTEKGERHLEGVDVEALISAMDTQDAG